ncbi:MAG: OmpA family protein [Ekhidna sp.]|nr:OmpA family protein [Ekhidna sp.]
MCLKNLIIVFTHRKSLIVALNLLVSISLNAQVVFEGTAESVGQINSSDGQNYLVLSSFNDSFAFTRERAAANDLYDQAELETEGKHIEYFVFNDDLLQKGMVSPIGFETENALFYSFVEFEKGLYRGAVRKIDLFTKKDTKVNIPFFRNKAPVQSGCLSENLQFMIISAESNNSYGVEDLYISKRKADGSWSSMKNLGADLNSGYQEITPFLAADNCTLFFASNRPGGSGSFDIYYSGRLDESWRSWSEPRRLGSQINTNGSESSFSFREGDALAYFVRSKDSDRYGDIFKIKIRESMDADTTATGQRKESVEEIAADKVVLKVVDAKNSKPLAALLITANDTSSNVNGIFTINSLNKEDVEIKSYGYLPKIISLDRTLAAGENLIMLASVAKGETIRLENVLFHRATANLMSGSEKDLDLVVEVLNDNPKISILLKGHTDNTGDPAINIRLSEERVNAVREYILSKGISAYRVAGKGYGGTQPIAGNEREETRKLNRRVEFEVIENE